MSTEQLIAEFRALSVEERRQVAEAILQDDSWIPESFRDGMADLEAGRTVTMEKAISEPPPVP